MLYQRTFQSSNVGYDKSRIELSVPGEKRRLNTSGDGHGTLLTLFFYEHKESLRLYYKRELKRNTRRGKQEHRRNKGRHFEED